MIITGLIEYMVAVVGNMVKGIINVDYKAIMEALMEIYSKVIAKRNIISIRN
jgi:hypothetical protein